ncbi:MAG: FtsX-like permease family protein, partial [candidate division WOR-3 bacterium]
RLPPALNQLVMEGRAAPVLIVQGAAYPSGRLLPVLIKGIDPTQRVLVIPAGALADTAADLPVLLGTRMAKSMGLGKGDCITLQWRNADGAFDARDGIVVEIMETSVTTIDNGQIWVPLNRLQELTGLTDHATLVTIARGTRPIPVEGWIFRNPEFLLSDLRQVVRSKTVGQSLMFAALFMLAMLAVFDTQVLSVFRRRREIGMLVALGMTRAQIVLLFTMEGALQSVLAGVLVALYGSPIFVLLSRHGFQLPGGESWGLALGERLYPAFTPDLLIKTTLLIFVATAFVAWLPARKIARFNPAEALSGRWT